VVVDRDVYELPADGLPAFAVAVDTRRVVMLAQAVADALAGAALDPAEPLDVDVHELAGARALVADRLLEPDPTEPAQPQAAQDARDGRERHPQRLGDLGRGEAQPAQCHDQIDPLLRRAVRDPPRRRRAINESRLGPPSGSGSPTCDNNAR